MVDEGKDSPATRPPEAPPPIITQARAREGRQWLMLLVYLLIALVVAAGVVLGGRWVYNNVRDEPAQEVTTTTSDRENESPAPTGNQPGTSPGTTTNPPPTPTPNPSTQGGQIADTGPGDTVAIFVGVSTVMAGLHYIITRRRANSV